MKPHRTGAAGRPVAIIGNPPETQPRSRVEIASKTPLRPATCALLAVPSILIALLFWAAIQIGQWLVVEDSLQPARAIAVLGGEMPFRAMEAARLYHRGLAREIWLTRGARPTGQMALNQLRLPYVSEETYNREVLERMGVPGDSVCLLEEPVRNTAEEVLSVARQLRRVGGDRVIVVTSRPHTRRVKATWRALVGGAPQVEVRWAADDTYDPSHWWRNTQDALAVSREFFGLLNVWAGFPVQPDRK